MLLQFILGVSDSPDAFLLFVNVIFVLFGAVLEGSPAIIILAPAIYAGSNKTGLDPIYFGDGPDGQPRCRVYTAARRLGSAGCNVCGKDHDRATSKPIMPYFLAMVIAMLLITYVPDISLTIPKMFGYKPIGSFTGF